MEEATRRPGRPLKYNSKMRPLRAAIPDWMDTFIEDLAEQTKKSRNEVVIGLLSSADKDMAKSMLDRLNGLNEAILGLQKASKDMVAQLQKLGGFKTKLNLYTDLEPDERVAQVVAAQAGKYKESAHERIKRGFGLTELRDTWTGILYDELEALVLKEGKALKAPRTAKLMIKNELVKLEV